MKSIFLLLLYILPAVMVKAQDGKPADSQQKAIVALIDKYSEAREKSDTVLLKNILTKDVDQLVSTGEWRIGIGAAIEGMLKSSANSPGTRTLTVNKIRMLDANCAIADCRYEIKSTNKTTRKMWSSFTVVVDNLEWKISAIRNMLPSVTD
jgi:ketosteroid isomerase-like protein